MLLLYVVSDATQRCTPAIADDEIIHVALNVSLWQQSAYQGPKKAAAWGASGSGHIHAMRPSVIAEFSIKLRGSAPVGT